MIYTSKHNEIIKQINSLKEKKYRQKLGKYISEGVKMVNEAVKHNLPIDLIVVTESAVNKIVENNFKTIIVSEEVFNYLSEESNPQGVLAVINIIKNEVLEPTNNCLVLDGIQDPGNMGTIIRTAVALGYKDLYLINCVDAYSGKVVRASMSGIYFVNLYKTNYEEFFNVIKGYDLLALDMNGEDLKTYIPTNKFCIAVGNEGNGISKEIEENCTKKLSIKMTENSESLNAGVALAIAMYQLKL